MGIHDLMQFYKNLGEKKAIMKLCFQVYLSMHDPYTNENCELIVKE